MNAMVLTAGLGTRLRPVTNQFAKPAVPFLNVPLLYYSVALLENAGVDSLVFNTHYKPEQIESLVSRIPEYKGQVELSHEPGAPLGSGGGIWKARRVLDGSDFLLANGDEVILPHAAHSIQRLMEEHRRNKALATLLVMKHPLVGTQFGGVWADSNGNVKGFGKDGSVFGAYSKESDVSGFHYIGVQVLSPRIFRYLPEGESNILYDALAAGIANDETVRVFEESFTWFETGNPQDFLHATDQALTLLESKENEAGRFLKETCRRFWKPETRFERMDQARVLFGPGSRIESGANVRGFLVLGENSVVQSGATVENSVVIGNSTVDSTAILKNAIALP